MENILTIVFGGLAAIITAAAALVRALRVVDTEVRKTNRRLHEYREEADRAIRIAVAELIAHGIEPSSQLMEIRQHLQQIGREIDNQGDTPT